MVKNGSNSGNRGVLISETISRQSGWREKPCAGRQIIVGRVLSLHVLTVVRCAVLIGCIDTGVNFERIPRKYRKYVKVRGWN